jgi:hypothetical protein
MTIMDEIIAQLIEIYAHCPCAEIGEDPAYQDLCRRYDADDRFHRLRDRIATYKSFMEKCVGIQVTTRDQVVEALKLLSRVIQRGDEQYINHCMQLTIKTYGAQWSAKQKAHYQKYSAALQKYYDYFLSFTTKNANAPYENKVNSRYRYLIKHILGSERYERDKARQNLFAEAIHSLLKRELLQGFFFPDREGDNTYLDEKLDTSVQNCFAFVQVVQNIMFKWGDKNYCFLEYDKANAAVPQHCKYYVLAEPSNEDLRSFESNVDLQYDIWYREVLQRDKIILEATETHNLHQIMRIKKSLQDKLVLPVKQMKQKCLENVPFD